MGWVMMSERELNRVDDLVEGIRLLMDAVPVRPVSVVRVFGTNGGLN